MVIKATYLNERTNLYIILDSFLFLGPKGNEEGNLSRRTLVDELIFCQVWLHTFLMFFPSRQTNTLKQVRQHEYVGIYGLFNAQTY